MSGALNQLQSVQAVVAPAVPSSRAQTQPEPSRNEILNKTCDILVALSATTAAWASTDSFRHKHLFVRQKHLVADAFRKQSFTPQDIWIDKLTDVRMNTELLQKSPLSRMWPSQDKLGFQQTVLFDETFPVDIHGFYLLIFGLTEGARGEGNPQNALLGKFWPSTPGTSTRPNPPAETIPSATRSDLKARIRGFGAQRVVGESRVEGQTIKRAVLLLDLLPTNLPCPQTSSSPDGEVGFFWFHNGNRVEAYLDGEGNLTWIGKFNGSFDPGGDEEWRGALPADFVGMLNKLYA
jgi:hypothetical protein